MLNDQQASRFDHVVDIVCNDMDVSVTDVIPPPGRRVFEEMESAARTAITLVLHEHADFSYPLIADAFGRKSHTSVMHWVKTPGRYAGLYPHNMTASEYAESVAGRVAERSANEKA